MAFDFDFASLIFSQETRRLRIETNLDDGHLLLRRLHCVEGVSQLFRLDLDLLSPNGEIKPQDIVGDKVGVIVQPDNEPKRFFLWLCEKLSIRGTGETRALCL
ncbi:hypothetical protein WMF28_06900 [Sorangium sp. So ce590]|uniref:hypothetical protein n=1 Tax=Sorangium sp. So ce590 TaxID=3133317 RepID=UPI003F5D693C